MAYSSLEDDLPELNDILALCSKTTPVLPLNLRRSPRKKQVVTRCSEATINTGVDTVRATSRRARRNPIKRSPKKHDTVTAFQNPAPDSQLQRIPLLPHGLDSESVVASSNNRSSPRNNYKPVPLPHVDSLLLPLSKLATKQDSDEPRMQSRTDSAQAVQNSQRIIMSMMTDAARPDTARRSPRKTKAVASYTSRYILREAKCNDDDEQSGKDDEDDAVTDLSGFIVNDNAELSHHEWSGSKFGEEHGESSQRDQLRPRRRLHRGRRRQDKGDMVCHDLKGEYNGICSALEQLTIEATKPKHNTNHEVEVIDLTSSPTKPGDLLSEPTPELSDLLLEQSIKPVSRNLFDDFDKILRLSPPKLNTTMALPGKSLRHDDDPLDQHNIQDSLHDKCKSIRGDEDRYETPPTTPPRSPSKLKSPSKLLSPSKRETNARSPHRQSTDAFWDLHTINEWHDINVPKKAPATSPRKGLARFHVWSDDSDDERSRTSEDSLPSPCDSPTKPRSPLKSPEKVEKKRIAEERKAEKAKRAAFDSGKRRLAQDLLNELDGKVTEGKLKTLAASTGGVNIKWSKTLRSTAGRANWRRTVSKDSGSPIKGDTGKGPGIQVEHFANIELAEKVIDCEERLVNTLAHEFCHLANFMVSNIRDQPHGASFKSWATKVTNCLRTSENELWRKVEVTTKHNYAINHKYLWVCVGRDMTKAMEFLNMDEDEGCGAEYGRHSKSIDPEKSRCGRCKGKLLQLRPKPRMSPVKKVEKMMEVQVVEISD